MSEAKRGDQVQVHYTGRLDNGEVFDSSEGAEPIAFEVGSADLIAGFSEGVIGMKVGETRELRVSPDQAYGEQDEKLVEAVEKSRMPGDVVVGDELMAQREDGMEFTVRVLDVTDEFVTLDGNHPLAGQTLTFTVTLVTLETP